MQEYSVDSRELNALLERIAGSPDVLREAKRAAFAQAGPKLKEILDSEIGGTGKVRRWQEAVVGSRGGYAAVRPRARTLAEDDRGKTTRYQVGQVTNAINSGHAFPGKAKARKGGGRVKGRYFYQAAQEKAEGVAQSAGEQIAQAIIEHLEGKA